MRGILGLAFSVLLAPALLGAARAGEEAGPRSRPFLMGFTRWPADLTAEGVAAAQDFAHAHGDLVSVMFIGGIPWPEALEGRRYAADVEQQLRYRPPAPKRLFLSISPLDRGRRNLAPYWGAMDNLPLPEAWEDRAFDSPEVVTAYRNFVLRAVEAMAPDYLAVGVELNILLSHDLGKWAQVKALYRSTYDAVKAVHPDLPVCFTTDVLHYRQLAREAKGTPQEREVASLMEKSDLFALSLYPHLSLETPRPFPSTFLDFAKRFRKPIAVAECGMTSQDVHLFTYDVTLEGSPEEQADFTRTLLETAARDRYLFVVNFATTDFEPLCARLSPPADDIARIWASTGLQTHDGRPKPALAVWDAWLAAPHGRR